jgi:hypothetical protein
LGTAFADPGDDDGLDYEDDWGEEYGIVQVGWGWETEWYPEDNDDEE